MRVIWLICGFAFLAVGAVGIFLPLLPTVPFMLLAAFCFSRSSERLHNWLLAHAHFGPPILAWRQSGAITRPVKWVASISMLASLALSLVLGFPPLVIGIQTAALAAAALFIWTRPDN